MRKSSALVLDVHRDVSLRVAQWKIVMRYHQKTKLIFNFGNASVSRTY